MLLPTSAVAENLVVDNPLIKYQYTFQTLKSQHYCDLATFIIKPPLGIKLTAAFVTDDAQPKDKDLRVSYIVEVSAASGRENAPLTQVKVVAARIVSDSFNTDLHSTKLVDTGPVAIYSITSDYSLQLFTSLMLTGAYKLYVELQNNASLTVDVEPTADILDAYGKWTKCSIAVMQHQKPPH